MARCVIALTGGGSGGHFYPLIAVAEALAQTSASGDAVDVHYLGPHPYHLEALQQNNISYMYIPAAKRRKYFSIKNFFTPFVVVWATLVALQKLFFLYPDVIFSKGSYTSVPVVIAATFLRIPIIIHESDTKVGSANKLATRFARYIGIAFDDVAAAFPAQKTALVGVPLRREFIASHQNPAGELGIPTDKPIIFVTGGSLGAERINDLILNSLDELLPHYTIIHQTGEANEETVRQASVNLITDNALLDHYFIRGTLSTHDMNLSMSAASLVISRAGSGTIFEIAAKGKPSIVIPIPESISHDQRTNAFAYARSGAAIVLEEENFTDDLLENEITRIMDDQATYDTMTTAAHAFAKPDAATKVAATIMGIAEEH